MFYDIVVIKDGDLIYIDFKDKIVNFVKKIVM